MGIQAQLHGGKMRKTANAQNSPLIRRTAWKSLNSLVFGPWAASLAGFICVLAVFGCMSINIGGTHSHEGVTCVEDANVLFQEGKISVRPGNVQVIHYPTSYASPPNL